MLGAISYPINACSLSCYHESFIASSQDVPLGNLDFKRLWLAPVEYNPLFMTRLMLPCKLTGM